MQPFTFDWFVAFFLLSSTNTHRLHALEQALRAGPQTAQALSHRLGQDKPASQPTVSRALAAAGAQVVAIGAARSTRYAWADAAREHLRAAVFRVSAEGTLHELGTLEPVLPSGFVMVQAGGKRIHSDGLPWWLYDMRPQGYLGRAYNQRHGARLQLPARLNEWSDRHILQALLRHGGDLPGNLLLGLDAHDAFVNGPSPAPIALAERPGAYAQLALAAARGELPGSSVAGEQPKFTAFAEVQPGRRAHVLVKFTAATPGPVSQRWRDLLLAEHVALQLLHSHGIPASHSELLDHGGQRFLQIERFDRVGARGRRAQHSLAALDAEFVGSGERWPIIVRALAQQRVVVPESVRATELLWAFGTLIGNTDMHTGNLAFVSEHGRPYQLAPAYDMTPMAFAPTAGGEVLARTLSLQVSDQVPGEVWRQALPLAQDYVARMQGERALSDAFAPCMEQLQLHVSGAAQRIARLA
ncbi:type II toxin-antitoxin system HipA family toxin YjjJ [Pulveribacter sp.]|uniref:type II toxin-antitoxin system HipA family toxin YjjJ n=1 Tax=Pulveribacter sp. TaxID=2678893 RepID=UPI0028AFCBBC|nr:type II toxin-antitoxin system HipA family toxin YjjJ [Pulveribacter sp.]